MTGKIVDGQIIPSNQFFKNIFDLGIAGFKMMVPVLCAYIAYSIGSKPALAPGFILGYVANNPIGEHQIATGFIGAIILGFIVGYIVKWIKTLKVPVIIQPIMPIFLIPLFVTLVVGIVYIYIMVYPLDWFTQTMVSALRGLSGINAAILGIGIGIMAAIDMGGPSSKAATAFTLALMAEGVYGPNGAFRLCCAVPPLGLALASFILRDRFTEEEKNFGISALFLSMAGITEGAIPFAGKDFKRVMPAIIIGTGVAGMLAMIHNVESIVAFGGLVAITGVINGTLWYAIDMFIGAFIIVLYLFITKPKITENN